MNLNGLKKLFRKRPKREEVSGVTTGMWDAQLWDMHISYYDPIARIYSPQDSSFRYPFGLYDEARIKNTHLQSSLGTRTKSTLALPVRLLPADKSQEAQERMMFVKYALERMGKGEIVGHLAYALRNLQTDGLFFPYTVAEILWEIESKEVVIHQIKTRHPRNFLWDDKEQLHFIDNSGNDAVIDPTKFLRYAPLREQDNPYKGGIGRNVYHIHHLWRLNLRWWGTANERGGIPLLVVKGVDFLEELEKSDLEDALDGLKNNTYIVLPEGIDVDAFESKLRAATTTFKDLAVFCKTEISKLVLGETLTAESGGERGSYSLGQVHQKILGDYIEHDAIELMALINGQLIPTLIAYNYPPISQNGRLDWLLPLFKIDYEPPEDLQKSLLVDQGLYSIGVPLSISALRDKYQLETPRDEEDTLIKKAPTTIGTLPSSDPGSQSEPDADNQDVDQKIKDTARDTHGGKGLADRLAASESIRAAGGLISVQQAKLALEIMDEFTDAVIAKGESIYDNTNIYIQHWLGQFDNLYKLDEELNYYIENLTLDELREYLNKVLFQAFVMGYHQMFNDPRIRASYMSAADVGDTYGTLFEPKDIIEIFEKREILERKDFDQISVWSKSRAFTVANNAKDVLVNRLKPLIQRGIYEGKTIEWFKEQTKGILDPAHAETVFRTNIATAYNTGRMDAIFHPDVKEAFPAITYFVVEDEKTTDICRALVGKVIPLEEVTQGQFVSPFHYSCRTLTIAIHVSDYKKLPATDLFTASKQRAMPDNVRPLGDFGHYTPIITT